MNTDTKHNASHAEGPGVLDWHKSSYSSGDTGNCVEVATAPASTHIRDSKDTTIAPVIVGNPAWAAFLNMVEG
ncbi:DUF397 domain-containing protein [Streptomyces sp. NPDC090053]|uniref:DUF397 domain-containing protein n=1 Tax=Streptomyces sp. NPDC090053 TaxID=3365932 RepID=UPI00382C38F7